MLLKYKGTISQLKKIKSIRATMANFLSTSFLLLLLSLFAISGTSAVFESIDCGATNSYLDDRNILWKPDEFYIQTGENQVVAGTVSDQQLSTLRVFTTRKKNCYSIDVEKGDKLLVRVSFYYGNYDKRSSPPTFDLQFDGNYWTTVTTTIDTMIYYEVIYVAVGDSISVCVAQTLPNNFPFISSLEVRSLELTMYKEMDDNKPLLLAGRYNFGANETVRYPDDIYDRIWIPVAAQNGLIAESSDTLVMDQNLADQPPDAVLQTALTNSNQSHSINLQTPADIPTYINLYFSEMSKLDLTEKRSFVVDYNNGSTSGIIVPPYESAVKWFGYLGSNASISLTPTSGSTLAPLICAMEVLAIGASLTRGTNTTDVEALSLLKQQFEKLQEWSGDPCLPANFTWDWITCSSGAVPRVTALYLNGFDLDGTLPDFSDMDALQTIHLQNNSLSGEIPDFLGALPNLKELNLADNDFSGAIPSSLSRNRQIKLVVTGNPNLCTSGNSCQTSDNNGNNDGTVDSSGTWTGPTSTRKKKSSKLPVILGVSLPVFLVFWVAVGILVMTNRRRKAAIGAVSSAAGGRPGGPTQSTQMGGHYPDTTEEYKLDIEKQMDHELSHLQQQHQQQQEEAPVDHNNSSNTVS